MIFPVDSLSDPRLDPYRHLKQTNLTRWSGRFIAEGRLVVERLLESPLDVESLLLSERRLELLQRLPRSNAVDVLVVSDELARQLTGFGFHAGVLACGRRGPNPKLDRLFPGDPAQPQLLVCCPHITDPDNLGSLIRLCRAFGVGGVLLGPACCDPYSRRTLRVSMGNAFALPIVESSDLAADLDRLQNRGCTLSATVLDPAATPLHRAERVPREVLLLGNEAHGLAAEWVRRCDRRLTIPMQPGADSLNVAVAAGICLHWLTRGEPTSGPVDAR